MVERNQKTDIAVVPYQERFGNLAPENAAACVLMASEEVRHYNSAWDQGVVVESHPEHYSQKDLRSYINLMQKARRSIAPFIGATPLEREAISQGNGETFRAVVKRAVDSLGDEYAFLKRAVDALWLPLPGGGRFPKEIGFDELTPQQRNFLINWRSYYIGLPTPIIPQPEVKG